MAQQRIDIFLDKVRCDIAPGQEIAISYSINQFQTPESRSGAFSTDYTLPFTHTNAAIFKNAEQLNSATDKPYVKIPCRIEANGVPQVIGYAQVKGTSSEGYVITVFGDNVDWFTEIGEKSLQDVDASGLDHEWDFDTIIASANNTWEKGYAYPVVDYGKFKDRIYESGLSFDELYPWVFRKYLLLSMFADIGYTLKGDFLTLPSFEESYIDLGEYPFKHSQQWINSRIGSIEQTTPTDPPRYTALVAFVFFTYGYFPSVTGSDSAFSYLTFTTNQGTNFTVFKYNRPVRIKIKAILQIQIPDTSTATNITVIIQKGTGLGELSEMNNPVTSKKTFLARPGQSTLSIEFESDTFDMLASDIAGVKVFSGTSEIEATGSVKPITYTGSIYQTRDEYILPNETFNISPNLPDISQGDFIKELANEFCLMFSTDVTKKVVNINRFESIKQNIPFAVNWSDKVDFTRRPIMDFNFNEYGQVNKMKYAEDDTDVELIEHPDYGNGTFAVDNQHLEKSKDVYESIYAATKSRDSFQGRVVLPFVPFFLPTDGSRFSIWNAEDTYFTSPVQDYVIYLGRYFRSIINDNQGIGPLFISGGELVVADDEWVEGTFAQFTDKGVFENNTPQPRVLVADRTNTTPVLILQPGTIDTYVEYVSNATFDPLRFDTLLAEYYDTFQGIMNKLKFLKAIVRLNAVDIARLDHLMPVFIDCVTKYGHLSGYFYVNIINQYRPGSSEACEVELLRLPAKLQGAFLPTLEYSSLDYPEFEYN